MKRALIFVFAQIIIFGGAYVAYEMTKEEVPHGNATVAVAQAIPVNSTDAKVKSIAQNSNNQVAIIPRKQQVDMQNRSDGSNQEMEPNGVPFKATSISLDTGIMGEVANASDIDHFLFTTPSDYRDYIKVSIENRSTTLKPVILVLNNEKAQVGGVTAGTVGADLKYNFVSGPDSTYYVKISEYHRGTGGAYILKVTPTRAYDKYEPNDDVFHAKTISSEESVDAKIMDYNDTDFYQFKVPFYKANVTVLLENRSTTLRPVILVLNNEKAQVGGVTAGTVGADLKYNFVSEPDSTYYVKISEYHRGTGGAYILNLKMEEPLAQ